MKSSSLYVDGIDVYDMYGMYIVQGGYNELIAYPPLKEVTKNDWQEEDGIEADLSSPVLNTREASIKFAVAGLDTGLFDFLETISDGAYHVFLFAEIGREYRLRLIKQPSLKALKILGMVTLRFADDFPLAGYTYKPPQSSITASDDYLIDGRNITDYGIRFLKGTFDNITQSPAVKPNMLRNIKSESGTYYDPARVTFRSKDVKLNCLMRAESLSELWQNYYALLHNIIQPNEHSLYVREMEREFFFCYRSCQVTEFCPKDRIWLQFVLTITFTRDFRISSENIVLLTENGIVVFTEDAENIVDLRPVKRNIKQ